MYFIFVFQIISHINVMFYIGVIIWSNFRTDTNHFDSGLFQYYNPCIDFNIICFINQFLYFLDIISIAAFYYDFIFCCPHFI